MNNVRKRMYARQWARRGLLGAGLVLAAGAQAAGVYPGPNYYGAWASASANSASAQDSITNTSGPPENGTPNGLLQAGAAASLSPVYYLGKVSGSVSAGGNAYIGRLGGIANASGVNGCDSPAFQGPCLGSSSYTEFYDQFHLTGAPDGTPVTIQFSLTTSGTVQGTGGWGYFASLSDGWNATGNSDSSGGTTPTVNLDIFQSHSWTATYYVGSNYPLYGSMNMGVGERTCLPTCTSGTAITLDLSHTTLASAMILTPGNFQLVSASGYDYINPVPIPAAAWLFGPGLLGLVGVARRKRRATG